MELHAIEDAVTHRNLMSTQVDRQWLETSSEHICKLGTHIKAERDPKPFARSYSSSARPGRSHVRGQPPARGAVGLQNLGNTCFMNSMLQCLSHTRPLTDYFLRDQEGEPFYLRQINEKNPLGSGGDLARAYASFIRDAWSGSYSTVTPSALKRAVSGWKSQFSGYQQQDSQELMMALLDGLHEDLNEIIQKPYVEQLESKGEPDHELAKESWRRFGLRNKSVVMDHCMGQLKSHITCDKCGHESILFDPYNHISLPLPAAGARRVTCTLFKKHSSQRPLKVIVAVQAKDTVGVRSNKHWPRSLHWTVALWTCVTSGATACIGPFPIISRWSTLKRMMNWWRLSLGREIGLLMSCVVGCRGMPRPIASHLTSCSGGL